MRILCLLGFILLSACTYRSPWADRLEGQDKSAVRRALGEPVIRRTEAPNQIWSYKTGTCSTLVYFDANDTVRLIDTSGDCSDKTNYF